MERIKTGIKGFDELLSGGFPSGRNVLISGTPGTGKTIFALQYLYNGAKMFNEKGLFVTFEENAENLRKQAKMFGWDLDKMEKSGKVKILSIEARDVKESTARDIISIVRGGNYTRLVIDSLSALSINTPNSFGLVTDINEIFVKRFIYHFINDLRDVNCTSILISQAVEEQLSSDGASEFACDGIIHIKYENLGGDYSRHLSIRKMRETKNDEEIHPMEIGKEGVVIHSLR
ncbi:MAG: ATPase domain-containing protein [Candidatus Woesearchaeota archaeon]